MSKWIIDGETAFANPSSFTPAIQKNVAYEDQENGTQVRITAENLIQKKEYSAIWEKIPTIFRNKLRRLFYHDKDFYITTHSGEVDGDILEPQYNSSGIMDYKNYRGMFGEWVSDNAPTIYKNDVEVGSGYTVYYTLGEVDFVSANTENDVITGDYAFRLKVYIDEYSEVQAPTGDIQLYDITLKLREV